MERRTKNSLVLGLSLLLLGGAAADNSMRRAPTDAKPYHARVQALAAEAPLRIGNWAGQEVPTPEAAVRLLRPNVIISRRFVNFVNGGVVDFLLVHCTDARDLAGHYPPICYPGQGWAQMGAEPHDWKLGEATVTGTQYEFNRGGQVSRTIANFMVLPNGHFGRDMTSVSKVAKDLEMRYFGAAQVQVLMDPSLSQADKDRIVEEMLEGHRAVIEAIRAEGNQ